MYIAIDVYYKNDRAKAVSIEFQNWKDDQPSQIHSVELEEIEEYIPGEFYKRELPCILRVLKKSDGSKVQAIIVDGYVHLDDEGKKGLGGYLFDALNGKIPIIGVAKKRFYSINDKCREVLRGKSKNPLFVTAIGMDLDIAAAKVGEMAGEFRFPELLKVLDQVTKDF